MVELCAFKAPPVTYPLSAGIRGGEDSSTTNMTRPLLVTRPSTIYYSLQL